MLATIISTERASVMLQAEPAVKLLICSQCGGYFDKAYFGEIILHEADHEHPLFFTAK